MNPDWSDVWSKRPSITDEDYDNANSTLFRYYQRKNELENKWKEFLRGKGKKPEKMPIDLVTPEVEKAQYIVENYNGNERGIVDELEKFDEKYNYKELMETEVVVNENQVKNLSEKERKSLQEQLSVRLIWPPEMGKQ